MFQPNFITFTSTDISGREPLDGKFKGNQNDGFSFVQFADGSGGLEKSMKDWVGNKTGRLYRAEILAAQEYLAAQVGKAMNAPVRDCYFTSPTTVIMPFINGTPANEQNETELPTNAQGTALKLFDYLVANADRRPKNWIITSDNRIVGIDHALCNFRPRTPNSDFVAEMWNNSLTLEGLERLRPRLAALVLDFTSLGMADKHENLMANFDRLSDAFQILNQVAVVVKDATTPPKGVQEAAQRALGWLKEGKAGSGFTPVGRKRASDLANAHPVSLDTLKRMKAYFDRHQVDQKAEGFHQDEDGYPSPGRVAWDAWGGDAGWSWATSVVESEVKKGDIVGHEFHGNQYTAAEHEALAEKASQEALKHEQKAADLEERGKNTRAVTHALRGVQARMREKQHRDAADAVVEKAKPKWLTLLDEETKAHKNGDGDKANQIHYEVISALYDEQEVKKGDLLGHDFHGNQHTGGIDGGGGSGEARQTFAGRYPMLADRNQVSPDRYKVSDGSSEAPASPSKFIGDSAADFTNAGGKTFEVKAGMLGYHDADALSSLQKEVDEEAKRQGFKGLSDYHAPPKAETEKYQKWSGLYMMRAALDPFQADNNREDYRGDVRIFIARDAEGKIAGAAQIQNNGYIHYIGSNNEVDGAGTALISNIIQNAADNDLGVAFEPLSTAVKFWETAGFKPKTEGSDTYVMRSAEVKQVAEELRGMKVQKGDNEGHPFRGNQFTSGQGQDEVARETQEHIEGLADNLRQVSDEQEQGNRLRADRHKIAAAWHFLRLMSDKNEVKKGEAEGHPFRGNQHTQGQGGAEMPANVAAFARNLKEFYGAGGKVERIDNYEKMEEIQRQAQDLQRKPEYKKMDDRLKQGIRFLAEAGLHAKVGVNAMNSEINPTGVVSSHLFVARNQDGEMVSAVNITTHSGGVRLGDLSDPEVPHAEIGYLGSTGTMPGAATALMEQALQLAAEKGLTVTYETTSDSRPYHDKLGVQTLNERGLRGFSPESAAEVAALPNPEPTIIKSEIIKGDLPGHVFHGNQHVEVASEGRTTSPRKPAAKKDAIAGLPKGWKMKSKDGSRVVLTSKNGNTAIFATKARGWKPSEKYSQLVLAAAERLTSGKTINFVAEADTGRNSLAYVNRYKPDVIGMGRYSTVKGTIDHQMEQFEKQVTNIALAGTELSLTLMTMEKGSPERDALIGKMAELYDQQPRTEAEVKGISHSYAAFATPEKVIETMMNHELGHSDFFAEGHKISEIYPALTEAAKAAYDASFQSGGSRVISLPSFTAPEIWAQTQENAARDIVSKTSSRYSGFDFGNGVVVPRADYVDYSVKEGAGSNTLRETPQSILRFLGVTQYGSTKLQETVAEARAFYSTPGLPKSALTNRLGEILGWDKTQKSATLSFVKAEDDSVPPTSANVYQDKDGNLIARVFDTVDTSGDGAITIVGEEVILSDGSVMSLDDYNASIPNP